MTKKIIFIVGLTIVIILVAYLLTDKFGLFKAEFKQEWKSCDIDQECSLVSTPGCCSCSDGDAINSKFINEYNEYRRSNTGSCWRVACSICPQRFRVARCVDNKCIATDWQTYRNEKYKYEIKAPKDWEVVEHGGLPLDLGMIESFWVQKGEYDPFARRNFLIVNVWDPLFLTTVDRFVGLGGVRGINIKRKEIILDQIPATEFTSTINENTPAACEGKQVFVKKDQLIISIGCASEKCDEIISTFKFIE